jgi:rubrerythrin
MEQKGVGTMSLKGTKTEKNILTAFAGESQARNRYTYFSSQAKKEGYVQIADIFEETANQEKEHAKRLFKLLEGGLKAARWRSRPRSRQASSGPRPRI